MPWGISENASDKEKIKAEAADYLNGLNCSCSLSYEDYSNAFDFFLDLLDKMYELGKKDRDA